MFFELFTSISWWSHSHYLIAAIAQQSLTKSQVAAYNFLVNGKSLPKQNMIECAAWNDDLNYVYFYDLMFNWHFSSPPFILEKFTGEFEPPTYSVHDYLKDAYETLFDPSTTSHWALSYTLRNLIHFVGDIHTPHHNVAMYNDTNYPHGDQGGNLYIINCEFGMACQNMHSLWDAVGFAYPILDPPATVAPLHQQFVNNVSYLMKLHPSHNYSPEFLDTFDPDTWRNESFKIAKEHGYEIPAKTAPIDSYIETVRKFSKERLCLAGYRLGAVLKKLAETRHFQAPASQKISGGQILGWTLDSLLIVAIILMGVIDHRRNSLSDSGTLLHSHLIDQAP